MNATITAVTTLRRAARSYVVAALVLMLAPGGAPAQTHWQAGTGDWLEPANWTAGVPTSTKDATIDNGGTAQIESPSAVARDLFVGKESLDLSFLEITGGGSLANRHGYLGYSSGSQGTATVAGSGVSWSNSYLYVGRSGTGELSIEAGSQVSSTTSYVGAFTGSQGTVAVTGSGSIWANSADLFVGQYGTGTLTVTDGGLVSAKTLWTSMTDLLGDGTIAVKGAVLDADIAFDIAHGTSPTLAFGTGGTLNLEVDGSGALGAGYRAVGTLTIAEGRQIASTAGRLGYSSGSQGTATVSGSGSKWTNLSSLEVGRYGTGTLVIEDGGQVSNTAG
jgi:T5SS/PEP-CTERM-associated repeat protein